MLAEFTICLAVESGIEKEVIREWALNDSRKFQLAEEIESKRKENYEMMFRLLIEETKKN